MITHWLFIWVLRHEDERHRTAHHELQIIKYIAVAVAYTAMGHLVGRAAGEKKLGRMFFKLVLQLAFISCTYPYPGVTPSHSNKH